MENNQKILIIGAGGQLGQSFIQELTKKGFDFLALTSQQLDITDFCKVELSIKNYNPNYVINCAAYNDVDKAEDEWEQAYLVNGVAVKNLALVVNKFNSILIHYSSDYVFAGDKGVPYNIADQTNPINKYGKSKLLGEVFVRDFCNKYYLIRLSSVFGNNPNASFPLKLLSWIKDSKEIKIVDDQVFSPTFVDDIVIATMDLIKTNQFGLYHMTNYGHCSRYEWAKYILDKVNWQGKCLPVKSNEMKIPAERPKFSVLDNFPLKNIIGYNLPSWQESTDKFLINNKLI
jgi:dTDP-4-dehydrorhamnose reductase